MHMHMSYIIHNFTVDLGQLWTLESPSSCSDPVGTKSACLLSIHYNSEQQQQQQRQ